MRRIVVVLASAVAACGGHPSDPADASGEAQRSIVNGVVVGPNPAQDYAQGVLRDPPSGRQCTATLIDNDLALLPEACAFEDANHRPTSTVALGALTSSVKVHRVPAGGPGGLVVAQTRGAFVVTGPSGPANSGYRRDPSSQRLRINDVVLCSGYGGGMGVPTQGYFAVADIQGDDYLLRSDPPGAYGIDKADVGGYCFPPGDPGVILAIITAPMDGPLPAKARAVDRLRPTLDEVRAVSGIARSEVAVSFINTGNGAAISTLGTVNVRLEARAGNPPQQAFYLWDMPVPPVPGQQWVLLPSARDGKCVALNLLLNGFTMAKCDQARTDQQFWLQFDPNLGYRLHPRNALNKCTDGIPGAGAFLWASACNAPVAAVNWAVWLNPY